MSNIDDLIKALENSNKVEVIEKKVNNTNWFNIILIVFVLGLSGFIVYDKYFDKDKEDIIIEQNVAEIVEECENSYSLFKSKIYDKLAELVSTKDISNRNELLVNAQDLLAKAKDSSLGKLNELDNKNIPEGDFEPERARVVKYLKDKSKGFLEASK